jgi:hypothetical protein
MNKKNQDKGSRRKISSPSISSNFLVPPPGLCISPRSPCISHRSALYDLQICPRSLLPLPFSISLYFLHIPVSSQDLSVFYVDLFVSSIVDFLLSFPDLSRSFTDGKEKLPPLTSTEAK